MFHPRNLFDGPSDNESWKSGDGLLNGSARDNYRLGNIPDKYSSAKEI